MATTIKLLYGVAGTNIACTLASLVNNGQRASAVVDNTGTLYEDALLQVTLKSGAASTSATGNVNIYAYASADGGTTYGDTATGADAGVTLTVPPNLRLIGTMNVVANATSYKSNPMSVAKAFDGLLPAKWGVVIENKTGGTLDATGSNFVVGFQGVQHQLV